MLYIIKARLLWFGPKRKDIEFFGHLVNKKGRLQAVPISWAGADIVPIMLWTCWMDTHMLCPRH